MLNEHEKEEGPEEGEYHFSDEGGYESNMEEEAKAPVVSEGGSLAAKLSSYRRFIVLGGIAAGVLLVIYLIIPPITTAPSADIAAVTTPPPVAAPARVEQPPAPAKTSLAAQKAPAGENQPANKGFAHLVAEEKEKLVAEKNKVIASITEQHPAPAAAAPTRASAPASTSALVSTPRVAAPVVAETTAGMPAAIVSPAAQAFIESPIGTSAEQQAATVQASVENKALLERLQAMAETHTKLIGQLQAEYAQKLAAYEAQDKGLQEQVRTLNMRLAGMEAEMTKLLQAINKQQASASDSLSNNNADLPASAGTVAPMAPTSVESYKANYTVQAIIPGRAWLRTDSGETITVAEGDILKSLGRVTKIDPYDGTIQIDTGSKVITLTYGNGDYA